MTHSSPLVCLRFLAAFVLLALLGVAIEHVVVRLPVFALHPVLPMAVLADMPLVFPAVFYLLVNLCSPNAAGWLLVAEGYGLLMLVAHGHAVRLQPTLLTADALLIRVGFFWQVEVPRAQLLAAQTLRGDFPPGPDTLNLARPLLAAPNVMLTFAAPVMVSGLYGICRPARRLALYLDQPAPLLAALAGSARS